MSGMLIGGIKFNDDELAPKQESTKFSAYYDKFKEIVFDWVKLKWTNGEVVENNIILFKSSDLENKSFKVNRTEYKFTTPTIAACVEKFNDDKESNKGIQILSKVKTVKARGKKILLSQEYIKVLTEMIEASNSNNSDTKK